MDTVIYNTCKYQSRDLLVQIKKHIPILDTAKGFAVPVKLNQFIMRYATENPPSPKII